jgi:hypothetical protein
MTMSVEHPVSLGSDACSVGDRRRSLDRKLASYLAAAGAIGTVAASRSDAAVVANSTVVPFGINQEVNIDFNTDGQTDFQLDHDRVNLNGTDLDYLQIDKNDISSAANPLAFDPGPSCCFAATPFSDGVTTRNDANNSAYVIGGPQGSYPAALNGGSLIGPASTFDFQEGDNFQSSGKSIRSNRLIDEDATQIDQVLGGRTAAQVQVPFGSQGFVGLGGQVRYLGVQMELNNSGAFNYGWIGVQITNEADATGNLVGWGYQTIPGRSIAAGEVPEPGTMIMAAMGGIFLAGGMLSRKLFRGR